MTKLFYPNRLVNLLPVFPLMPGVPKPPNGCVLAVDAGLNMVPVVGVENENGALVVVGFAPKILFD